MCVCVFVHNRQMWMYCKVGINLNNLIARFVCFAFFLAHAYAWKFITLSLAVLILVSGILKLPVISNDHFLKYLYL